MRKSIAATLVAGCVLGLAGTANAGALFLTGHDPDFHAQGSVGAKNLLTIGLNFATGGTATLNDGNKFLWVEARIGDPIVPTLPGGHLIGENGLGAIGLSLGTHYDRANGAEFLAMTTAQLSSYTAIAVASSFGGILTSLDLNALIARKTDIENFVNAGGGIFASSECTPTSSTCNAVTLPGISAADLLGFLPVSVTSVGANSPFTVTPFGASLGLVNGDLNDPTHNSFGLVGGLNVVDTDAAGNATTLAGIVTIDNGTFTPTPEPASLAVLEIGIFGLGILRRRRAR